MPETHFPDCRRDASCRCETRRYVRILFIGAAICLFEITAGVASGSLALLADAGHVAVDMSAIAVAIAVSIVVRRHPQHEHGTRAAGFAAAIALLALVASVVVIEAVQRISDPKPVVGLGVALASLIGACGNWWQHRILHGAAEHRTHRALHVHIRSDLVMSIGVALSGILIWMSGFSVIDAIVSLAIAAWIFVQIVNLLRHPDSAHPH